LYCLQKEKLATIQNKKENKHEKVCSCILHTVVKKKNRKGKYIKKIKKAIFVGEIVSNLLLNK
jgi:hypothetical protein